MELFKKFKFPIILGVIVLLVVGYLFLKPTKQPRRDTMVASRMNIVQSVNVVGNVKSAESVDLAFELGGKVKEVYVKVGDSVEAGTKLAELNHDNFLADLQQAEAQVSSAYASLDQYKAALTAEQARLREMESGTRSEEISIAQTKVDNAKSALNNAEINLENTKQEADITLNNLYDDVMNILNDAYAKSDDAINEQVGDLFTTGGNIDFSFEPNNSQLELNALTARQDAVRGLANLQTEMNKTHTSNSDLDSVLEVGRTEITKVRTFLNLISDVLKGNTNLTSATLSTYKTDLNTARTNVNTALTNISNQQQSILSQVNTNRDSINTAQTSLDSAKFSLQTAEQELNLKLAGYTKEQLDAQKAKVLQAEANISSQQAFIQQKQANVTSVQAQINKNIIYSPIKGTVTKQDAKAGEITNAQTPVISIISEAQFEIETNIPEVDIAKIKIGNKADVTLDAYGDDEKFEAQVISIDPAEKVIEGVSTYKTVFQFVSPNDKIRSGMTADLEIMTNSKDNVIAVPNRAVAVKEDVKKVKILQGDSVVEVTVETGLRGSNGMVEILSGIKEGDVVVTFME